MKVILSIKPKFVEKIFTGEKKYEYRKALFSRPEVKTVLIYCTMPVGKLVGEFTIDNVLIDNPAVIWQQTFNDAGIEESFFNSYYDGRDKAVALQIHDLVIYDEPIDPKDKFTNFIAPQSFRYIEDLV